MKTFFSGCSGLGSIFQIFPLTVNQRPETATLPTSRVVYLLLCFLCKVSIHHLLRLFYDCLLLKWKNWCLLKISASFSHTINSYEDRYWLVTGVPLSPLINVWPTLTKHFCTMSFNRKLIKFFGGNISKLRGHVCFFFCVDVARILSTSAQAAYGQFTLGSHLNLLNFL